jgi:hypothetical protein
MGSRKERLAELVDDIRSFRLCGPSDDPDLQTAVTTGYRHLLVQFKRLAAPLLPESDAARLNALEVDVHNLYSVFDAHAEVGALLPDIEEALRSAPESLLSVGTGAWIVSSDVIRRLVAVQTAKVDTEVLVGLCREINSSWSHGNVVATALVMRAVLNYVPPVFGHETFPQVVAQSPRTLKEAWSHLEEGLRKVADFHAHRRLGPADIFPSPAQVEPFKPQFELLLHEVLARVGAG